MKTHDDIAYPYRRTSEAPDLHGAAVTRHLEKLLDARRRQAAHLGLREEERAAYSVSRAITSLLNEANGRSDSCFELEVSRELSRDQPNYDGGMVVPWWVFANATRALTAAGHETGAELAGTYRPRIESMMLALQGRSVIASLPIESLPGCTTNFSIPVEETGPTTTTQAGEEAAGSDSTPQLGSVAMSPKTETAIVKMSRQFLVATGPAGDAYARRSILSAVGARVDALAMSGTSAEGEPWGLISQISQTTTGASLNESGVRGFQTDIGNALGPDCAWVADRTTASLLNGRQRFTGSDRTLWEGNVHQGELGGWPAYSAPSIPAAHLLFGAWSNVVLAEWGAGIELLANPYTSADFARGAIQLRAMVSFDIGLKRPAAFKKGTAVS